FRKGYITVILNGVKNLGRGAISYFVDTPPQILRSFAHSPSETSESDTRSDRMTI
ncbi:MAG: hypothetical protein HW399_1178, partial [Dehalococcoidia bacterium]|nr:hypothetical protein [Dehalococcoidia bacterium]